ncbi:hypothetical protein [Photobacterium sp. Hal280]|uniref:hypothetical protein n=1 Tax=Photobacterium sp. Hal280 TaxID=3035163 RepID=UPI00301D7101
MDNLIEEQRKLIEQLYRIVKGSCPVDATSAKCRFEYDHGYEDGSESVGETFYYTKNGESVSAALRHELAFPVVDLVPQLHAKMKAHAGEIGMHLRCSSTKTGL